MKYIKKFENLTDVIEKKYWLVPTDHRYEQSLKDIGMEEKTIQHLFLDNDNIKKSDGFVFAGWDYKDNTWGWNPFLDIRDPWFEDYNYKFMGVVNSDEAKAFLMAKKYNL